jgi:hypothetical protein
LSDRQNSARDAVQGLVKAVNSELTGILRPGDSRWLDPDWFEVTDGEPDLPNSDSNTFQSCATINLSPKGKATLISKLATIDTLRERIWQHGHEIYWSSGVGTDMRAVRDFVSRNTNVSDIDLTSVPSWDVPSVAIGVASSPALRDSWHTSATSDSCQLWRWKN